MRALGGSAASGLQARRSLLLGAAACGYLLLHVVTLTRSPVPYFDDTFFASVGDSLARRGELRLAVSPLWMDGPVYLYGPVYFLAQSFVFQQLGFGIFQSRMLGLVFGVGTVLVVFASLRQAGVRREVALWACILLALDPTLHLSLHSGRMENVALFFILVSFLLLQRSWAIETRPRLLLCATAGLLAALGILTTPRPAYLVVCMGAVLLMRFALVRTWPRALQLLSWGLPLVGLYLVWVWYAFGGIAALTAYYGQLAGTYVGGPFAVRGIHYPLLAILAAVTILRLLSGSKIGCDELVCFTLAGVVAFYALGINPPRFGTVYAVLTIPFVYMAIARLASGLEGRQIFGMRAERIQHLVCAALLVFNAAAFSARTALELMQWRSRDPARADQVVRTFVPRGSKVIGDDKFYFAVINAGSDFQYWQRGGTLGERVAYQTDGYGFDYLITNADEASDLFRAYAARVALVKLATLEGRGRRGVAEWLDGIARRVGVEAPLVADYQAALFVRADRQPERR